MTPLHGYGTKKDGSGHVMFIGLTPEDVFQLRVEPMSLPVDARFKPTTEVVMLYGTSRDSIRTMMRDAVDALNIPLTIERPKKKEP